VCVFMSMCVYTQTLHVYVYVYINDAESVCVCVYMFTCLYTAFPSVYVCPKNPVDTCPLHEAKRVGVVYIGW